MISSAPTLQIATTHGATHPATYKAATKDESKPRRLVNSDAKHLPQTFSNPKRRGPYDRMNPPPIPHRRSQSLQSSFFQQIQQSPPSGVTPPLTQPSQELMISRHYLLGNVCFSNFLQGPSNRFTTLMTETLECGYCREAFPSLETLKGHLIRAPHSVWICCHNLYRSKRLRDNHRKDYGCQAIPVPGNCGLPIFYESVGKGEFTLSMKAGKCGYCDKETGSPENLREHLVQEGLKVMGHEVWYSYGRFFREAREMERWKEFCEMGNEDDCVWAGADGAEGGVARDGPDQRVSLSVTRRRRRTMSHGSRMAMTGMI